MPVVLDERLVSLPERAPVDDAGMLVFDTEEDVLEHGAVRDERRLLGDDRDPVGQRVACASDSRRRARRRAARRRRAGARRPGSSPASTCRRRSRRRARGSSRGANARSMSTSAWTPPKRFETPRSSAYGAAAAALTRRTTSSSRDGDAARSVGRTGRPPSPGPARRSGRDRRDRGRARSRRRRTPRRSVRARRRRRTAPRRRRSP